MSIATTELCDQDASGAEQATTVVYMPRGGQLQLCDHHFNAGRALFDQRGYWSVHINPARKMPGGEQEFVRAADARIR